MRMISKKQLEIALSKLRVPEKPSAELEQYPIPSEMAADILNAVLLSGDIEGLVVLDLGCGSGRLAIGSAMLGAAKVVGVDIDKSSVDLAIENAKAAGVEEKIEFVNKDISDFSGECDTVIMNPPFGMRGGRHADRTFLAKALSCVVPGGRVYSLHRGGYEGEGGNKESRAFLTRFAEENGGKVLLVKEFKFDIPNMFKFHKKPKVSYDVDLFVIERVAAS
jgi:putative methylase